MSSPCPGKPLEGALIGGAIGAVVEFGIFGRFGGPKIGPTNGTGMGGQIIEPPPTPMQPGMTVTMQGDYIISIGPGANPTKGYITIIRLPPPPPPPAPAP